MTAPIIIRPRHPRDPASEIIEELALDLRKIAQEENAEVVVHCTASPGHQVSPWETILVWLPWDDIAKAAVGAVIATITGWLRRRHQKAPDRPKAVTLP